jgi:hypothetical protein
MGKGRNRSSKNRSSVGANNAAPIDGLDGLSLQELQIMAQAAPIALRNRLQRILKR